MATPSFDVKEQISVIRENDRGEKLEVNRVSWYGKESKIDIRYWKYEGLERVKPNKGLTLTDKEYEDFCKFFKNMEV